MMKMIEDENVNLVINNRHKVLSEECDRFTFSYTSVFDAKKTVPLKKSLYHLESISNGRYKHDHFSSYSSLLLDFLKHCAPKNHHCLSFVFLWPTLDLI